MPNAPRGRASGAALSNCRRYIMDRSARTQNPYLMADWLKPYMPARCDECGQPLAPAGSDWANQWYTTAYAPMMDNLNRMWSSMAQPWGGLPEPWGNLAQTW